MRLRLLLAIALLLLLVPSRSVQAEDSGDGWVGTIRMIETESSDSSAPVNVAGAQGTSEDITRHHKSVLFVLGPDGATGEVTSRSMKESITELTVTLACTLEETFHPRTATTIDSRRYRDDYSGSGPASCEFDETSASVGCGTEFPMSGVRGNFDRGSCSNCCPDDGSGDGPVDDEMPYTTGEDTVEALAITMDEGDVAAGASTGSQRDQISDTFVRTTSWSLYRKNDYRLELSAPHYDKWRPRAGRYEDEAGSSLLIEANLVREDGKPLDAHLQRIVFRLDSSREPGVALNWPPEGKAVTTPDLQFDPARNQQFGYQISEENLRAGSDTAADLGTRNAYVIVSAYDFGAWGELTAEAWLSNGQKVVGRMKDAVLPGLRLPRRAEGDPIAASWLEETGRAAGQALSDDDEAPEGDGHGGDALSLYEEYRGVFVNGEHRRLDPHRKDYFLVNEVGALVAPGIATFKARTGLEVHSELWANEVGSARTVNFNSASFTLGGKYFVRLIAGTDREAGSGTQGVGTPREAISVSVVPQLLEAGASPDPQRQSAETEHTVAHELGHTVNISHHGGNDLRLREWRNVDGGIEEFLPGATTNGYPVEVYTETDLALHASELPLPFTLYLASEHGEHSGVEDCMMRYDVASAIERSSAIARNYLWATPPEQPGTNLCTSKLGTGVNAPSHAPRSRYGDAAKGQCAQQLCVNDNLTHSGH